jgi:alkanesulfonate monooxygenase SsuD/methylene tetrahydromethanopterin reductase-like flavin-dependent oxidoreductase (luciferase family)
MDIGIGFPNMVRSLERDTVLRWAVRAEEAGFASLSAGERLSFDSNDVFVELSLAAAVTERIRLLSSVVVLPLHTTAVVAKQAATLSHLSGGRFDLGVGSGGHVPDYDAAPVPWDRRIGEVSRWVPRAPCWAPLPSPAACAC